MSEWIAATFDNCKVCNIRYLCEEQELFICSGCWELGRQGKLVNENLERFKKYSLLKEQDKVKKS